MKGRQLYLFGSQKDNAQNRYRSKVIFHFDTLILSGVVVILLLTISFSLGVERGKTVVLSGLKKPKKVMESAVNLPKSVSAETTGVPQ